MGKKLVMIVFCILFASAGLLLSSCAKKGVTVSDRGQTGTAQDGRVEGSRPGAGLDRGQVEISEAERQRRLRELEAQKGSTEEVREFENVAIYFDYDRADLTSAAQAVLKKKAEWLMANPSYSVLIEGHTDERGTDEYNLALGDRRAGAAKTFLVALGIPTNRISTISYGEERPADPRQNEEAWAKNRRDEFRLYQ
jgi:peptidoglycan-associated lipoprotein